MCLPAGTCTKGNVSVSGGRKMYLKAGGGAGGGGGDQGLTILSSLFVVNVFLHTENRKRCLTLV